MKVSNKKRRFINWHFWPKPKNYPILSVWEFVIYNALIVIGIQMYWVCQRVPVYEYSIDVTQIHVGTNDSTKQCKMWFDYRMPMSYSLNEDDSGGCLYMESSEDYKRYKDSVEYSLFGMDLMYPYIHYKDNKDSFNIYFDSVEQVFDSLKLKYNNLQQKWDDSLKVLYRDRRNWGHLKSDYIKKDSLYNVYKNLCDDSIETEKKSVYYVRIQHKNNLTKLLSQSDQIKFNKKYGKWENEVAKLEVKNIQYVPKIAHNRLRFDGPEEIKDTIYVNNLKRTHYEKSSVIVERFIYNNLSYILSEKLGLTRITTISRPSWLSPHDISQFYYKIRFNGDFAGNSELKIDFVGAAQFSLMVPEPDEITMSSIKFTNPEKIKKIKYYDLEFHAIFNELQNTQNTRNFFITILISTLFVFDITFIIISVYKISRKIRINTLFHYKRHKLNKQRKTQKEAKEQNTDLTDNERSADTI